MGSESEPQLPTLRTLAKLAGVSCTAVSLALRGDPKISPATQRRVQQIALRAGYRPDPEISRLMHHLRSRRTRKFQATMCALTSVQNEMVQPYAAEIIRSAERRADSLGYKLTLMHIEDVDKPRPDLQRVLRSRGIAGILLLPMRSPREFNQLLDWSQFSVVAATYGVLSPQFHRVVPHQFSNMMQLCQKLKELRYRRIGMVLHATHDLRVHYAFSAAISWQNMFGGTDFVQPLIDQNDDPQELEAWFKREKPDVIVSGGYENQRRLADRLGLAIPGPIGFATTSVPSGARSEFAGIDELPGQIGARATELLASMVQRGEKGIPDTPTVTMVEGRWTDGPSVRTKARSSAPRNR
jgi:DNA-binding LacI/PurR family transcriptional regulator